MSRKQFAAGMLAAALAFSAAGPVRAYEDTLPQSSEIYLTADDLAGLDCEALWHARNEIYARNGYKFLTAKAQAEFGTEGTTRNPKLNKIEQKNIALIQQFEAEAYCGE